MKYAPLLMLLLCMPFPAQAAVVSGADTSWMLISTALVMLMTPGLAFFYAGRTRSKNAVSTLYQNIIALGIIGMSWAIIGYSLAFAAGNSFIGDATHLLLRGVGQAPADGKATSAHLLFAAFQMMFAIFAAALMTGAFAERIRFKAWIAIVILWSLLVYAPVAHWVWSPRGWLASAGALDFAGGFAIHMTAGWSALVAAIVIGKRRDFGTAAKPYDVGMTMLGASLLWFGWFGLTAGAALTPGGLAVQAFVNTFFAAACGMLAWTLIDSARDGKPTAVGGCIGIVTGLIAITPAAGFVNIGSAMLIGLVAGVACNLTARMVKSRFRIDDTLNVFACNGIGGTLGVLMTGLLATTTVNAGGANGWIFGSGALYMVNVTGAIAVALYSMIVTYAIITFVNMFIAVRASDRENMGLDAGQHGEEIYGRGK